MKSTLPIAAVLLLTLTPAFAHRLDEYLQGTIISVESDRVDVQITLTPGVAVFPILVADIDANADGTISEAEQHVYAGRVLRDLSISIDGHHLTPHLVSARFPAIEEMMEGRGEIRIEFDAVSQRGGPNRRLAFENHHQSRIAAYQVNCLVPRDPSIRILAQNRNYTQSSYELDFEQAGARADMWSLQGLAGAKEPLGMVALMVFGCLALLSRRGVSRK